MAGCGDRVGAAGCRSPRRPGRIWPFWEISTWPLATVRASWRRRTRPRRPETSIGGRAVLVGLARFRRGASGRRRPARGNRTASASKAAGRSANPVVACLRLGETCHAPSLGSGDPSSARHPRERSGKDVPGKFTRVARLLRHPSSRCSSIDTPKIRADPRRSPRRQQYRHFGRQRPAQTQCLKRSREESRLAYAAGDHHRRAAPPLHALRLKVAGTSTIALNRNAAGPAAR